jgi:hypothetical protein
MAGLSRTKKVKVEVRVKLSKKTAGAEALMKRFGKCAYKAALQICNLQCWQARQDPPQANKMRLRLPGTNCGE